MEGYAPIETLRPLLAATPSFGQLAAALERGEAALKIKAGYVYYVQLTVSYRAGYGARMELVPHREGAAIIAGDRLKSLR